MRKYTSMATNSQAESSGRDQNNKRWETLTLKLNSNGPPIKNCKAWKKTWADYKHRTKQKLAENKNSLNKTGGGPYKKKELTPFEEAVVELAKIRTAVYGISDIKTFSADIPPQPPMSQRPASQPPTSHSSSSSSSWESKDSLENLVRALVSSDTEEPVPAPVPAPVPLAEQTKTEKNISQPSASRGMMDKLEMFKNSASSSEDFHKKVVDVLLEIRDLKREEVQILKQQSLENATNQKRKLFIREQELKVGIRTNELKEYELGLKTQH